MRNRVKNICLGLLLCGALAGMTGCASRGQIDAEAAAGILEPVVQRHQGYVQNDPNLSDVERSTYLRSGALAQKLLDEARRVQAEGKADKADAPAEPAQAD